jgi:hypothetical protein
MKGFIAIDAVCSSATLVNYHIKWCHATEIIIIIIIIIIMFKFFCITRLKGRNNLGELGVDSRIILKCISQKHGIMMWNEFVWLKNESSGGPL